MESTEDYEKEREFRAAGNTSIKDSYNTFFSQNY